MALDPKDSPPEHWYDIPEPEHHPECPSHPANDPEDMATCDCADLIRRDKEDYADQLFEDHRERHFSHREGA